MVYEPVIFGRRCLANGSTLNRERREPTVFILDPRRAQVDGLQRCLAAGLSPAEYIY